VTVQALDVAPQLFRHAPRAIENLVAVPLHGLGPPAQVLEITDLLLDPTRGALDFREGRQRLAIASPLANGESSCKAVSGTYNEIGCRIFGVPCDQDVRAMALQSLEALWGGPLREDEDADLRLPVPSGFADFLERRA
jgi:hypothetical protein